MTVLGPVAPDALGPVLMHEHLLCDLTAPARRSTGEPEVEITLENHFEVNYRPGDYFGNHRLNDRERAVREAGLFREAGGGTIVEMTTGGIGPDLAGWRRFPERRDPRGCASRVLYGALPRVCDVGAAD
jgi:phosphotriesterase-related protein